MHKEHPVKLNSVIVIVVPAAKSDTPIGHTGMCERLSQ